MSEEKMIKHAENAVHIVKDKNRTWQGKIKELFEEVAIIVFAVSITLAFHNWNDWRNEHKMEKEFLEGISEDLKNGAKLIGNVSRFNKAVDYHDKVWQQMLTGKIDAAYIDTNSSQLVNSIFLSFDNGRFEGFKSSGYLRLIENKTLLKDLTSLYIRLIPFEVKEDENFYNERRASYNAYIGVKAPIDNNGIHVSRIINDPAVRYQVFWYGDLLRERIEHKKALADKMRKMAAEIDQELNK